MHLTVTITVICYQFDYYFDKNFFDYKSQKKNTIINDRKLFFVVDKELPMKEIYFHHKTMLYAIMSHQNKFTQLITWLKAKFSPLIMIIDSEKKFCNRYSQNISIMLLFGKYSLHFTINIFTYIINKSLYFSSLISFRGTHLDDRPFLEKRKFDRHESCPANGGQAWRTTQNSRYVDDPLRRKPASRGHVVAGDSWELSRRFSAASSRSELVITSRLFLNVVTIDTIVSRHYE